MAKSDDEEPRVGRPPRGGEAGGMIGIRVTAAEREQYEKAAAAKSMTLAEWIRDCCKRILGRK